MTGEKKQKTGDRLWTYIKEEAGYWRRRTKQAPLWSGGLLLLAFVGLAVLGVGPYAGMDGSRPVGVAPGTAGFIRWHFYANSDRPEDQLLKLEVKDRILEEAEAALAGADSAAECRRLLSQILPRLRETGQQRLDDCGSGQKLAVYYGPRYFAERQLDGQTLPEGVYESVTFILGDGQGTNWWGLLFPPLSPGKEVHFYEPQQAEVTEQAEARRQAEKGTLKEQKTAAGKEKEEGALPVVLSWKIFELFS